MSYKIEKRDNKFIIDITECNYGAHTLTGIMVTHFMNESLDEISKLEQVQNIVLVGFHKACLRNPGICTVAFVEDIIYNTSHRNWKISFEAPVR